MTLDPDKMITNNLLLSRGQRYPCRPRDGVTNIRIWETPKHTNLAGSPHFHPEKMCRGKKICFTSFQRLSKHVGRGPPVNTTSSCYNALNTIKCMRERGLRGCFTYTENIYSLL